MSLIRPCALLAVALLVAPAAHAQFFQNTTGIVSPARIITFAEVPLPQSTPLTNQYAAYGVTFSGLFYNPQTTTYVNQSSPIAGNFPADVSILIPTISIFFTTVQNRAAFSVITNGGTTTFSALRNGVVVSSMEAPTTYSRPDNYYGFAGVAFDQILVSDIGVGSGGGEGRALIDNIQLGTVAAPEPGTIALLLTAGVPVAGLVRRRRKAPTIA